MTTRKRNEYLDIGSDDEGSDRGYDSEAAEESKGRSVKRRRTTIDGKTKNQKPFPIDHDEAENSAPEDESEGEQRSEDDDHNDDHNDDEEGGVKLDTSSKNDRRKKQSSKDDDEEEDGRFSLSAFDDGASSTTTSSTKKNKPVLDKSKPLKPPKKKNKTGVIYFSSLPPYLKPFALKSLLEARGFGPITRVFLTPAVPSSSSAPKRSNKRKTYSDGWVEFESKKTAKICAETLNATIVGGRKGGWYHDDVWNMKYLRGFKWADLMEQVQRERSEREAKRRIEDARARKEEKVFLAGVEKGKVLDGIQKKKEEKKKKSGLGGGSGDDEREIRRLFRQNEVKMPGKGDDKVALAEDTKRVLGKIF